MEELRRQLGGGPKLILICYESQKLSCFRKIAGFFVIEDLGPVAEDQKLSRWARAHLYLNPLFGSCIAQAHGRAAQVKSKEAASNFDHASLPQIAFAARIVFT